VKQYLEDHYRTLERLLDLGPFHHLLPPALRRQTVIDQFHIPRFLDAVTGLQPLRNMERLSGPLSDLVTGF